MGKCEYYSIIRYLRKEENHSDGGSYILPITKIGRKCMKQSAKTISERVK
jgi:hypothetical protein